MFQLMIAQNKTKTLETSRGPQGYCNYLMAAPGAASIDVCAKQNKDRFKQRDTHKAFATI